MADEPRGGLAWAADAPHGELTAVTGASEDHHQLHAHVSGQPGLWDLDGLRYLLGRVAHPAHLSDETIAAGPEITSGTA